MGDLTSFVPHIGETLVFIAALIVIIFIGAAEVVYYIKRINDRRKRVTEFRNLLIEWYNEGGSDQQKYNNLVYLSPGVQEAMGQWGTLTYKPPFQNYMINNWQVILNGLTEIYDGVHSGISQRMAHEHMKLVDGALLRFLGYADEQFDSLRNQPFNPIRCFVRGVNIMLSMPIILLLEFGLISKKIYGILIDNLIFRLLVFSASLIGIISGIMTIALGWDEFTLLLTNHFPSLFSQE